MEKNYKKTMKLLSTFILFLSITTIGFSQTFDIVLGSSPATCEISSDGTAYVESQTGGVEPLTYAWGDGQDFVVAYNLMAGEHSVTVTDATGATATATVTVELSPESVWLMPAVTSANCECNGTIDPMAMLGLPPYSYEWSDGQTGAIATGLCAGTYTVTVSDSQGCANTATAVVGETNENCEDDCTATAASISTDDPTTICADDGVADMIDVTATGGSGANKAWVITDDQGNIVALPPASPFNLEGAGAGVCLIWCLNFEDGLKGAEVGANANDLEGCFALSNPITVTRNVGEDAPCEVEEECGVEAPMISTEDPINICAGDGIDDMIDVASTGGVGTNKAWVITDDQGNILALPEAPPFNLEGAGGGVCLIWCLVYEDGLVGAEVGANANNLEGCFALSNAIGITRGSSFEVELEVTDISACGADDGAITATTTGGSNLIYTWNNGSTDASISGLDEGTYIVLVTDGDSGCTAEASVTLDDGGTDVGDYVWFDNNENCEQDFFESGVAFVPVYLYSFGPDGEACTDDDVLEQSTGTDTDGHYLFECVENGEYYIQFFATAVEPDYVYTCQNGGADDVDSDANDEGKTAPFTVGGSDILTIDAGIYPICNDVNWAGQIGSDQTICAGEIPDVLTSSASAGGGGVRPVEYLWLCSGTPDNPGDPSTWTPIPNSNSADYQPGPVYQTKYFVRCARREGCDSFNAESNTVTIQVVSCGQMLDFDAVVSSNKEVNLTWSIDGDTESNVYFVERSFDGLNFETVLTSNGKNAYNTVSNHQMTDVSPKIGRSFYRIKQITETGNYRYSEVKELRVKLAETQSFSIYPNPAREVLTVENVESFETQVTVEFMTPAGKILHTAQFDEGTFKQEQISLKGLPSGNYFVRVIYSNQDVELIKVSKLVD